jgi:tripartite-type tricarboxylate transporter receptor subunit TctC
MIWKRIGLALCAFGLCALMLGPKLALADPVADFYKGKTINILAGFSPGGGYDINARVLARHATHGLRESAWTGGGELVCIA